MRRQAAEEDGAILLIVLVVLAMLAALAGLVLRVSESDLATLAAERAAFRREVMVQSAVAVLGVRLGAGGLTEDGSDVVLAVPGGEVVARVRAASGLINPNFTRASVLEAGLTALGAAPQVSARLVLAILAERAAGNRRGFGDMAEVEALFVRDRALWPKVAPYLTLLGRNETIDIGHAPPVLQVVAAPVGVAGVDFSGSGRAGLRGFYEIWLHVSGPLDVQDPEGRLWTHVSALAGTDLRLHILRVEWPQVMAADGKAS